MKMRLLRLVLIFVLFATLVVLPVSSDKGSVPQVESGLTVVQEVSPGEVSTTQQIWTKEAMAAAKPYPAPELDADALASLAAQTLEEQGEPGFAAGGLPDPAAAKKALSRSDTFDGLASLDVLNFEETGTSNVYTTYGGNAYSQLWKYFPYHTVGTLYFNDVHGGSFRCSASVISPNNIIVTAAHCLYDTEAGHNHWHRNWLFAPAYRNGTSPYGNWTSRWARVLTAYVNAAGWSSGIRYDVGLVRLSPNSLGRNVSYYTGYMGRSWNYGSVQNQTEIGYPANLPSGSLYSYISHAETWGCGTDLLCYGSNMGSGASGSPLLRKFGPYRGGAYNYVNAVQSGSSPNGTSPVYNIGPRFSSYNIVPLCTDEGC